jgi:hypothetical protein
VWVRESLSNGKYFALNHIWLDWPLILVGTLKFFRAVCEGEAGFTIDYTRTRAERLHDSTCNFKKFTNRLVIVQALRLA